VAPFSILDLSPIVQGVTAAGVDELMVTAAIF